jgi:hypothetical protein
MIVYVGVLAHAHVLTPKFGTESDLWVQRGEESVRQKEGFLQMNSAEESAVGNSFPFGKETVALILWDLRDDVARAEEVNG